jgi:hypothetical protein
VRNFQVFYYVKHKKELNQENREKIRSERPSSGGSETAFSGKFKNLVIHLRLPKAPQEGHFAVSSVTTRKGAKNQVKPSALGGNSRDSEKLRRIDFEPTLKRAPIAAIACIERTRKGRARGHNCKTTSLKINSEIRSWKSYLFGITRAHYCSSVDTPGTYIDDELTKEECGQNVFDCCERAIPKPRSSLTCSKAA